MCQSGRYEPQAVDVQRVNELALINRIRKMAGTSGAVQLGIGDDCAIYRPRPHEDLLFTADQMIEGIHFLSRHTPRSIGQRALARSLSDIAAMGGTPRFCLVSLAVPSNHARWVVAFYRGLLRLANGTRTALAGGDLSHAEKIYCDVMVCGSVPRGKALRRDGARPGDQVCISGRLGKSWDRPILPRLALGHRLVGRATACIDLSDGLSLDLHRLCLASQVAAELDLIPIARGSTQDRALNGGEDYELLFTLPSRAKPPRGAIRVGTIVRGVPGEIRIEGRTVEPRGYDHFRHD
jgi:thiamine-monophosphate kinase